MAEFTELSASATGQEPAAEGPVGIKPDGRRKALPELAGPETVLNLGTAAHPTKSTDDAWVPQPKNEITHTAVKSPVTLDALGLFDQMRRFHVQALECGLSMMKSEPYWSIHRSMIADMQ